MSLEQARKLKNTDAVRVKLSGATVTVMGVCSVNRNVYVLCSDNVWRHHSELEKEHSVQTSVI